MKSSEIKSAKDLIVYQKAYALALQVFDTSRRWPTDEKYGLTSQIRRSSRSVSMNLREAWAKRRYEAHFILKLSDCAGENAETDTSIDFAKDHGFISAEEHQQLIALNNEVGKMLTSMILHPEKFVLNL
ncbi:MAG: four helix bundle protein [Verrucomicrobiaceae bacterium]